MKKKNTILLILVLALFLVLGIALFVGFADSRNTLALDNGQKLVSKDPEIELTYLDTSGREYVLSGYYCDKEETVSIALDWVNRTAYFKSIVSPDKRTGIIFATGDISINNEKVIISHVEYENDLINFNTDRIVFSVIG